MKQQSVQTLISAEFQKSFVALAILFSVFFLVYESTQFLKLTSNIETLVVNQAVTTVEHAVIAQDFLRVQWDLERLSSTISQESSITVEFAALSEGRMIGESSKRGAARFIPPMAISTRKTLSSGSEIEVRTKIYFESLIYQVFVSLFLGLGLIGICYFLLQRKLSRSALRITEPLLSQIASVKQSALNIHDSNKRVGISGSSSILEIEDLRVSVNTLLGEISSLEDDAKSKAADQTRFEIAEKVAHDIVSPVAALRANLSRASLDSGTHAGVIKSLNRIQEIIGSLKSKSVTPISTQNSNMAVQIPVKVEIENIQLLVNDIIFEKQVQFADRPNISLKFESSATALFSKMSSSDFKRMLSNLLNNAFEAIESESGTISVTLAKTNDFAKIEIVDSGKGIDPELLTKLMAKGASFGKTNGSGLGLYSSKQFVDQAGGNLRIVSAVGVGTTVSLELPLAKPSKAFLDEIVVEQNSKIISVDDDSTIASIWRMKLSESGFNYVDNFTFFSNPNDFLTWFEVTGKSRNDCSYFFDQELRGFDVTGTDLAVKAGLQDKTVIVTSHGSKKSFQEKCERLGVRCLPKDLLYNTPFRILNGEENLSLRLIN